MVEEKKKSSSAETKTWQCPICKFKGKADYKTPGNIGFEILLWLLFSPVGLGYSIWRHIKRGHFCPRCGSDRIYEIKSSY